MLALLACTNPPTNGYVSFQRINFFGPQGLTTPLSKQSIELYTVLISLKSHLFSRSKIHAAILACFMLAGVFTLIEMRQSATVIGAVGRCYFLVLGGVWLIHGGGILNDLYADPSYDLHAKLHLLAAQFVWDALLVVLLFLVLNKCAACKSNREYQLLNNGGQGRYWEKGALLHDGEEDNRTT